MQKVMITGGAGFVGSHLVEALLQDGAEITIVDDFSNSSDRNVKEIGGDKVKLVNKDIVDTDWSSLHSLDPDVIFHLATHPRSFSIQDPMRNMEVNVKGMLNMLEFARKKNSKVVYTSNTGIYGNPPSVPVDESFRDDPFTPYDANKLIGEHYGKIFHKIHGLYFVTFRLATIFGERQKINEKLGWHPVIPEFVQLLLNNRVPTIHWDGKQTRDFTYVKDVVNGLILGAKSNNAAGEVFNLSTNKETSIMEVYQLICKILNKDVKPTAGNALPGDIRRMRFSYDKAKRTLGYEPKYTLEESVRRYINWFQSAKN